MSDKLTLVERAKKIKINQRSLRKLGDEEIDLWIAWVKDEIHLTQASDVLGIKKSSRSSVYCRVATALRQAVRQGKLIIRDRSLLDWAESNDWDALKAVHNGKVSSLKRYENNKTHIL